jgi:hypothetical protein
VKELGEIGSLYAMSVTECRHPEITVELIGQDGNALSIIGHVKREVKRAGSIRQRSTNS